MVPKIDQHSLDFFLLHRIGAWLDIRDRGLVGFQFFPLQVLNPHLDSQVFAPHMFTQWLSKARHGLHHQTKEAISPVGGCLVLTAVWLQTWKPMTIRSKSQRDPHRKDQYNIPVNMGHSWAIQFFSWSMFGSLSQPKKDWRTQDKWFMPTIGAHSTTSHKSPWLDSNQLGPSHQTDGGIRDIQVASQAKHGSDWHQDFGSRRAGGIGRIQPESSQGQ